MKSKIPLAIVLFIASVFFFIGSFVMSFDLRPIGIGVGLLFSGIVWGICGLQKRKGNVLLIVGNLLVFVAATALFATINMLPDYRPLATSVVVLMLGLALSGIGWQRTSSEGVESGAVIIQIAGLITMIILFGIAGVLFPQIAWEQPGNPAAVMLLSALTGLGVMLAVIVNHRRKILVICAGLVFIVNFSLIHLYERGVFDFVGIFLRKIEPFYTSFDALALTVEYSLIAASAILLLLLMVRRKARVSDFGGITLTYLLLTPILATLLFEMLGLQAGESTTRADLLATNTTAVMETIGIVFIAVFFYILFQFLPLWIPPLLAGFWWMLWKIWLLHHPLPDTFMGNFTEFAPFLFLSAFKRIALPMVLILWLIQPFSKKKPDFKKIKSY